MAHQSQVPNPFMLMIQPEVVIAAMESSERLGKLNRHLCRPLDRIARPGQAEAGDALGADDEAPDAQH